MWLAEASFRCSWALEIFPKRRVQILSDDLNSENPRQKNTIEKNKPPIVWMCVRLLLPLTARCDSGPLIQYRWGTWDFSLQPNFSHYPWHPGTKNLIRCFLVGFTPQGDTCGVDLWDKATGRPSPLAVELRKGQAELPLGCVNLYMDGGGWSPPHEYGTVSFLVNKLRLSITPCNG